MNSFHVASNLLKAFFRFIIKKRKESAKAEDRNKAYFEMRKIAKQFRHINTELMIAA